MKLGWCSASSHASSLHQAGYDFIECPLAALDLETPENYRIHLEALKALPIPVSAFNIFFPRSLKIVGPEAAPDRIQSYIDRAAEAVHEAKAQIVVLGSGGSRHIPEGTERKRAEEQFAQVLRWIDRSFSGSGAIVVIEPLNRKESNFINSIAEAVQAASQIQSPVVQVLADVYHMMEEEEPLEEIRKHASWISHVHLADTGRLHPGSGTYDYPTLSAILQEVAYNRLLSVECTTEPITFDRSLKESLEFLRNAFPSL